MFGDGQTLGDTSEGCFSRVQAGEMCPYSHKALFEIPLSWKLGGVFGGHGGTKAEAYKTAASTAPLASLAGDRAVSRAGMQGPVPALGCHPCPGSHDHFSH